MMRYTTNLAAQAARAARGVLSQQAAHFALRQAAPGSRLFQAGATPGIFRRLAAILLARAPVAIKPFMSSSAASPHSLRLLAGLVASASLASAAIVQQQQQQQQLPRQNAHPSSSSGPPPASFASSGASSRPSSSSSDAAPASPRMVPFAFKTSSPLQPGTSPDQVNAAFEQLSKDPTGMYGWASVDRAEAAAGRVDWGSNAAASRGAGADDAYLMEYLNHGLKPLDHGHPNLAGGSLRAAGSAPTRSLTGQAQEGSSGQAPVWASALSERSALMEWSGVTAESR